VTDPARRVPPTLPVPILKTLGDFENAFGVTLRLMLSPVEPGGADQALYVSDSYDPDHDSQRWAERPVVTPGGSDLTIQAVAPDGATEPEQIVTALAPILVRVFEAVMEADFFTYELSERFEEINLLYSISETLGSTLDMDDGAKKILAEVRDVMGARRGSLWVYDPGEDVLNIMAEVGVQGRADPLPTDHPDAVTSMVFREGQAIIASRKRLEAAGEPDPGEEDDSFLSVPIRYTPASGESRTVGVINLIGRHDGGRFSGANQKLLAAIASQIGAALENHRLVRESLSKERMTREMELAHDLQMKLLPVPERLDWVEAAGRVQPTEQVGGDFYQLFKLSGGRIGVMLGDVSLHGFPSALIMTLTMSAAGIYARESTSPAEVLRSLDDALAEELETTEMFLTVFYGVLDPGTRELVFANAGHPHAFLIRDDGTAERLLATDPPVGFAGPDSYQEDTVYWDPERDVLLLFTDGLSDALATPQRTDGENRILEAATRHRYRPVAEIVDELFALSSGDPEAEVLGDDRTALVVRA
jgi:sigma-B regulation protein RsbU (phosphoserine phosphatase)